MTIKRKNKYYKKPNVVIELTNNAIKIVVGFILDKKPVILYSKSIITHNLIQNGNILDAKTLVLVLKQIKFLEDEELELNLNVNNVVLVLPIINLKIYHTKTSLNKDNFNKINLISLIRKTKINTNEIIIDYKILHYYINQKKSYKLPKNVNCFEAEMLIYTLPKKMVASYNSLFDNAKIQVIKKIINVQSICNLSDESNYLYVDIGFGYTSISLITQKVLIATRYFMSGGAKITELIAEKFNTTFDEAEKIKKIYGYTEKTLDLFNPVIFNNIVDNKEISYTVADLNNIIKNYFDEYCVEFDKCLNYFLSDLPDKNFPIIIGGGGSKLNGLSFLLKNKYDKYNIKFISLNVIGARNEEYFSCVGTLFSLDNDK